MPLASFIFSGFTELAAPLSLERLKKQKMLAQISFRIIMRC